MADAIAASGLPSTTPAQITFACRLVHKEIASARGPLKNMGEVELENTSPALVEIPYQMSPLQYLDLFVTGPSGSLVSEGHFGDRFSPMRQEHVLRLQPGEKFRNDIPLLGTVPQEKRTAGVYKVQAVYEYDGIRVTSNMVEVIVS
jgi:hypothetical protein